VCAALGKLRCFGSAAGAGAAAVCAAPAAGVSAQGRAGHTSRCAVVQTLVFCWYCLLCCGAAWAELDGCLQRLPWAAVGVFLGTIILWLHVCGPRVHVCCVHALASSLLACCWALVQLLMQQPHFLIRSRDCCCPLQMLHRVTTSQQRSCCCCACAASLFPVQHLHILNLALTFVADCRCCTGC
jgi:hypothetical protein